MSHKLRAVVSRRLLVVLAVAVVAASLLAGWKWRSGSQLRAGWTWDSSARAYVEEA